MRHPGGMRDLVHRLQAAALRLLLRLLGVLPLEARRRVLGGLTGGIVAFTPLRARGLANLALVWPDRDAAARRAILRGSGRNIGRTLANIWYPEDFAREVAGLVPEGPGLDALRAARAEGRGAILVSGHFGQWEAIRHVLRREGLETGAIYRENNNPHYDPIFRKGIEGGGLPIIPRGAAGYRILLRHLREGGFIALLPDQYVWEGTWLGFLGQPALTSLAAAELALRYDAPLVPAFAPVEDGRVRVVFEAPVAPSDPETMMREVNARLSSWVTRHPSQWHWLHRRWKYSRKNAKGREGALRPGDGGPG